MYYFRLCATSNLLSFVLETLVRICVRIKGVRKWGDWG